MWFWEALYYRFVKKNKQVADVIWMFRGHVVNEIRRLV